MREIEIDLGPSRLGAYISAPIGRAADEAQGLIIFAHGSGSSRHSPRNHAVAQALEKRGFVTLLADLLELNESADRNKVFDIELLTQRLILVTDWAGAQPELEGLKIGYFGASTGAAAALRAAAQLGEKIAAVVSRGGRPDLAESALANVEAPTLLLVGEKDNGVIDLNEKALAELTCEKKLSIIPSATHLFEEPGTLEEVARQAEIWFADHLNPHAPEPQSIADHGERAQTHRSARDHRT